MHKNVAKACDIIIALIMLLTVYAMFSIDYSGGGAVWFGVFIGVGMVFGVCKLAKAVIVSIAKGFDGLSDKG